MERWEFSFLAGIKKAMPKWDMALLTTLKRSTFDKAGTFFFGDASNGR